MNMTKNNLPFEEYIVDGYNVRIFEEKTDSDEFVWHRDKEDRIIESIHKTNWKFQKDNELPINFDEKIFIEKEVYHRLIKGEGDLILKIKKLV